MKSNRERIYDALKRYEEKRTEQQATGMTTIELSTILEMQRPNISSILNKLVEEGIVEKSNGRPVVYWLKQKKNVPLNHEISSFDELIGHDGSLKNAVSLTKAALLYPQEAPYFLIVGKKGTGKSYFASLIFRFAIEQGIIAKDAPYIKVNCKNYIGHEDKLSNDLFSRITMNYFDQAEGGFLFIDSVDLLVGKDRSRLMHFIEKKEYFYLDDDKPQKKNVALILACEENANHEIIEYYSQRIMITIKLPSLAERPLEERFQLINHYFLQEASQANQAFEVTNEVIRCLMLYDCPYNLRQLAGVIRIACANAFLRNRNQNSKHLLVVMSDFNENIRQ